ncbi:MAG: hypothetical protein ACI82S_002782, partial [Patiriisocius sp.]
MLQAPALRFVLRTSLGLMHGHSLNIGKHYILATVLVCGAITFGCAGITLLFIIASVNISLVN